LLRHLMMNQVTEHLALSFQWERSSSIPQWAGMKPALT